MSQPRLAHIPIVETEYGLSGVGAKVGACYHYDSTLRFRVPPEHAANDPVVQLTADRHAACANATLDSENSEKSGVCVSASCEAGGRRSAGRVELSLGEKEIDLELVQRVQRGDKTAFDVLVLKYQHKIVNLVGRYVHDAHEAQDVAQEAFIKAYRGLANFRGDSAFYTWLYRIAINTAKNYLITMGRKVSDSGIDAAEAEQFEGGTALREYASPEREALSEEIAAVVRDSIQALPEDLRTAITLREFEGLSYEDIAAVMECPIGTVRSRIFRAREAIDANLAPLMDESSRSLV